MAQREETPHPSVKLIEGLNGSRERQAGAPDVPLYPATKQPAPET